MESENKTQKLELTDAFRTAFSSMFSLRSKKILRALEGTFDYTVVHVAWGQKRC